jgi:peptidoglycan hydrolase-like protein with peptidoglycan-binding domain
MKFLAVVFLIVLVIPVHASEITGSLSTGLSATIGQSLPATVVVPVVSSGGGGGGGGGASPARPPKAIKASPVVVPVYKPVQAIAQPVKVGSKSPMVKPAFEALQQRKLISRTARTPKKFTYAMANAVKKFQRKNKLKPTGVLDIKTLTLLVPPSKQVAFD